MDSKRQTNTSIRSDLVAQKLSLKYKLRTSVTQKSPNKKLGTRTNGENTLSKNDEALKSSTLEQVNDPQQINQNEFENLDQFMKQMGTEEGTGGYGIMSSQQQENQNLHTFEPVQQYKETGKNTGVGENKNGEVLLKTYGALSFSQRAPSEEKSQQQADSSRFDINKVPPQHRQLDQMINAGTSNYDYGIGYSNMPSGKIMQSQDVSHQISQLNRSSPSQEKVDSQKASQDYRFETLKNQGVSSGGTNNKNPIDQATSSQKSQNIDNSAMTSQIRQEITDYNHNLSNLPSSILLGARDRHNISGPPSNLDKGTFGANAARQAVENMVQRQQEIESQLIKGETDQVDQLLKNGIESQYAKKSNTAQRSPETRDVQPTEETNPDLIVEQPELGAAKMNKETTRLEIDPNLCSITSDYEMVSDIFVFKDLMEQSNFGVKRYKNATYKGQIDNQSTFRQGFGVQIYSNSARVYEGEWREDQRNGQGYEVYKNGAVYKGFFKQNKPHGKGVYHWKNGEVYDGEWLQSQKQGFGIWKGNEKDSYAGEWKNNQANGYGVHVWTNGDQYEGEWMKSLKHGKGTDKFQNKDVYTGQYELGLPNGQGFYKWKSGSSYTGNFLQGRKHGSGKWKKNDKEVNCNQYLGEYKNDVKDGQGQFTWESGNYYKGSYSLDKRHGYGEMFWDDGTTYKGQWQYGSQHGYGKLMLPNGDNKEGLFENNTYVGPAGPNDSRIAKQMALNKSGAFEILYEDSAEQMQLSKSSPLSPNLANRLNQNDLQINIEATNVISESVPQKKKGKKQPIRVEKSSQTRLTLKSIKKEDPNMPKYVTTKTQTEPLGKLGLQKDVSQGTDMLTHIKFKPSEYISQNEDSQQQQQPPPNIELEQVQESQGEYDSVSQITGNKNIEEINQEMKKKKLRINQLNKYQQELQKVRYDEQKAVYGIRNSDGKLPTQKANRVKTPQVPQILVVPQSEQLLLDNQQESPEVSPRNPMSILRKKGNNQKGKPKQEFNKYLKKLAMINQSYMVNRYSSKPKQTKKVSAQQAYESRSRSKMLNRMGAAPSGRIRSKASLKNNQSYLGSNYNPSEYQVNLNDFEQPNMGRNHNDFGDRNHNSKSQARLSKLSLGYYTGQGINRSNLKSNVIPGRHSSVLQDYRRRGAPVVATSSRNRADDIIYQENQIESYDFNKRLGSQSPKMEKLRRIPGSAHRRHQTVLGRAPSVSSLNLPTIQDVRLSQRVWVPNGNHQQNKIFHQSYLSGQK